MVDTVLVVVDLQAISPQAPPPRPRAAPRAPLGDRACLGLEGGGSYRVFFLPALGSGGTSFGDIYDGDMFGMPIHIGPHAEAYPRF
jgi:hypothetical protein